MEAGDFSSPTYSFGSFNDAAGNYPFSVIHYGALAGCRCFYRTDELQFKAVCSLDGIGIKAWAGGTDFGFIDLILLEILPEFF